MKVLFIDDRPQEVRCQWERSGCACGHELLPLEPFMSLERTVCLVKELRPDAVVVGHGLSHHALTGTDVIRTLRAEEYAGYIIANSGGGKQPFDRSGIEINASANRNPHGLKTAMDNLMKGDVDDETKKG